MTQINGFAYSKVSCFPKRWEDFRCYYWLLMVITGLKLLHITFWRTIRFDSRCIYNVVLICKNGNFFRPHLAAINFDAKSRKMKGCFLCLQIELLHSFGTQTKLCQSWKKFPVNSPRMDFSRRASRRVLDILIKTDHRIDRNL